MIADSPAALQVGGSVCVTVLTNMFAAEVSADFEQHLGREEQHHCVPGTSGHHLTLPQQEGHLISRDSLFPKNSLDTNNLFNFLGLVLGIIVCSFFK